MKTRFHLKKSNTQTRADTQVGTPHRIRPPTGLSRIRWKAYPGAPVGGGRSRAKRNRKASAFAVASLTYEAGDAPAVWHGAVGREK